MLELFLIVGLLLCDIIVIEHIGDQHVCWSQHCAADAAADAVV